MEEEIMFSGQQADILDENAIKKAIKIIEDNATPDIYNIRIVHNCDKEKWDEFLERIEAKKPPKEDNSIISLYGINVHSKKYVPLNEIWMVDNNGKLIKKFKL